MKKLFNKKFILILASAMLLLVVLVVGSFLLTNENKKSFSRDGYIISFRKEEASEKVYFDEGTNYKTNINSQLVFTDTSGEKVNVDTDNFLHYTDGGIKFLKNGVIMDLENINAPIVPYYNITNKTVLEYSNKAYYVEAIDKTLAFNNLIGRISDNKYIVAGVNIKLQLAGNEKLIEGDYFEITFIEDGIIKVENKDISYQTTAQSSYVLVNDTTRIDLGTKKIYYNNEEKMSMSQMTIDGNENIEIVPEKEDDGSSSGGDSNEGEDNNIENPPVDNPNQPNGGNDGSGEGQPGEDVPGENPEDNPNQEQPDEKPTEKPGPGTESGSSQKKNVTIELIKAEVGANDIMAKFAINDPDKSIEGNLVLSLINMDTGKVLELGDESIIDKNKSEQKVEYDGLAPDSNYLLTITEVKEGSFGIQYFQKLFRTDTLGLKLEKKYITSNSIAYTVDFGNSSVQSVKAKLKNSKGELIGEVETKTPNNNLIFYDKLESNKNYTLEVDSFVIDNCEYSGNYSITKNIKTLKRTPDVTGLVAETNEDEHTFKMGLEKINDPDGSIVNYKYYIYKSTELAYGDMNDPKKAVLDKETVDKSPIVVNIDEEEKIDRNISYKYIVVVEYYDNEKYGEIELGPSKSLVLTDKPEVIFLRDDDKTTFNKISGTITITDKGCIIPVYGRLCYTPNPVYRNNFILDYSSGQLTGLDFKVNKDDPTKLESYVEIAPLASGEYTFDLYADVDPHLNGNVVKGMYIDSFDSSTISRDAALKVKEWKDKGSTLENLISVNPNIIGLESNSDFENETLANAMKTITFKLYPGDVKNRLLAGETVETIAERTIESENLRDYYYKNTNTIIDTLNTFEIKATSGVDENGNPFIMRAIDVLKSKTSGNLQSQYTIEIAEIKDEAGNIIPLVNGIHVFETPGVILVEEQKELPNLIVEPITKTDFVANNGGDDVLAQTFGTNQKDIQGDTIVAFKVYIDEKEVNDVVETINGLYEYVNPNAVKKLVYYVCDEDKNPECTIEEAIATHEFDLTQENLNYEYDEFWLYFGTKFSVKDDTTLTRGHNYVFKAKFLIDTGTDGIIDTVYPSVDIKNSKEAPKQNPFDFQTQIIESTADKVTYKFDFVDIDNAMYDNKIYYTITKVSNNSDDEPSDPNEEEVVNDEENVEEPTEPDNNEPIVSEKMSVDILGKKIEISGLATDDVYKLFYKVAPIKNTKSVREKEIDEFIFDGKLVYDTNTINFDTIYSDNGNKARIIFKATNSNQLLVDRISAYHVILSADGVEDFERVYPTSKATICNIDDVIYRCIILNYNDIKQFKGKDISIKVNAYYDTGITNNTIFGKNVLLENENGFILQQNNYYKGSLKRASYLIFNNDSPKGATNEEASGIYKYELGDLSNKNAESSGTFYIKSLIDFDKLLFASGELTPFENYYKRFSDSIFLARKDNNSNNNNVPSATNISLNNKYLDKVEVGSTNNQFKFNNIIPEVKVTNRNLVNGSEFTIKPYGIDSEILKNEFQAESDGKYYYYIDIYTDSECNELYRQEKIEIDLENKKGSVVTFVGFMPNTTYHFKVSAIVKKVDGSYKKTILFKENSNNDYGDAIYSFSTLNSAGIIKPLEEDKFFTYKSYSSENRYSERDLEVLIETNKKIGDYQVRIELYDNVNLTDGNPTLVLEDTLDPVKTANTSLYDYIKLTSNVTDPNVNINLIYGGSNTYTIKAYMLTESCVGDSVDNRCDTKEIKELEIINQETDLRALKEPTISVSSESTIDSLTFYVTINDIDSVAVNGTYCYEFTGNNEKREVCGLSITEKASNYPIKFENLASNKLYSLRIKIDHNINNFIPTEKPYTEINVDARTKNDFDMSVGDVSAYTNNSYSFYLLSTNSINISKVTRINYELKIQSTGVRVSYGDVYIPKDETFNDIDGGKRIQIRGQDLKSNVTYTVTARYYIEESALPVAEFTGSFEIGS